jgi:hypothetical protein
VSATIKADGDTWRAESGGEGASRALVFFCESTNQRPYRVVAIDDRDGLPEEIDQLSADQLRDLFDRSRSMGAPTSYPTYES